MFCDREDAARQLAARLKGRELRDPLVLAIPRGGVVTGAVLAREIGAELDVVLSRKLRAPFQEELAIGAVSEDGQVYLNQHAREILGPLEEHLAAEREHQIAEIARRKNLVRTIRPQASVAGRSVIVTAGDERLGRICGGWHPNSGPEPVTLRCKFSRLPTDPPAWNVAQCGGEYRRKFFDKDHHHLLCGVRSVDVQVIDVEE